MDKYTATEVAFKNGYAKGYAEAIKEFAERLTDKIGDKIDQGLNNPDGYDYFITDVYTTIDNLAKEMGDEHK